MAARTAENCFRVADATPVVNRAVIDRLYFLGQAAVKKGDCDELHENDCKCVPDAHFASSFGVELTVVVCVDVTSTKSAGTGDCLR